MSDIPINVLLNMAKTGAEIELRTKHPDQTLKDVADTVAQHGGALTVYVSNLTYAQLTDIPKRVPATRLRIVFDGPPHVGTW